MASRARFKVRPRSSSGFSLIELVVVIAILGILIGVALPNFLNVQKDAKISQAKNALATIVKECTIASLRGKSTTLSDISSANGALSGFILSSQGQFGKDFLEGDCYKDVAGTSLITINAMADAESQELALEEFPVFSITYSPDTGATTKSCLISVDTRYKGGCNGTVAECVKNQFGQKICPPNNGIGSW